MKIKTARGDGQKCRLSILMDFSKAETSTPLLFQAVLLHVSQGLQKRHVTLIKKHGTGEQKTVFTFFFGTEQTNNTQMSLWICGGSKG